MQNTKALWEVVMKTDPRAVKPITGKSYQGNSPKPYWLIEKATEVFGPIGIGWGVTVKSERFERLSDHDVLHVAVVSVWYVYNGKRSETFDQMGGTKAAYMTSKDRLMVDEDAGKKSVTDGMVKCLSMIGFAGDIFSGRWDDSKYVEATRKEFIEAEREKQPEPEAKPAKKSGPISPLDGAGDGLSEERKAEIQNIAAYMAECHERGKDLPAIEYWYSGGQTDLDHDERVYLWHVLKPYSKLRSAIKANKPETTKEAA